MGFLSKLFGGSAGVRLVKTYSQQKANPLGQKFTCHYEIYRARTAQEAREFLEAKTVTEPCTYVVIETPEGNWGKDKSGVYKENSQP